VLVLHATPTLTLMLMQMLMPPPALVLMLVPALEAPLLPDARR
jgi:hypothetical protein